jgi:hypothetical protein
MITAYLVAHPTALVDGDSGAPDPVARLIAELIAVGAGGLARPRCLDCGEERRLIRRVEGGRVCNRCVKRRRPLVECSQCGQQAQCARRDEQRRPFCNRCYQRVYLSPVHRCGVCGVSRTYRTQKRICRECAELPHASCAACGLPAAIPNDRTAPRCSHCATGTSVPCRECGGLTAGRDRKGRPRCERCYQRPSGPAAGVDACARSFVSPSMAIRICARSVGPDPPPGTRTAGRSVHAAGSAAGRCGAARAHRSGRRPARTADSGAARVRSGPRDRCAAVAMTGRSTRRAAARGAVSSGG